MRILYICYNPPWQGGGTFYRAFGFAKALVQRGHEVTLLTTSVAEKWQWQFEVDNGVRLVLSPSVTSGSLRSGYDYIEAANRILWLRGQKAFDLVHGFECRPNVIYPALFAEKQGAALFLDWCDWFGRGGSVENRPNPQRALLRPLETYYEEHFRNRAIGTTVINEPLRQRALGLGIEDRSIMWLPNGAEVDKFQPKPRSQARQALNLASDNQLIGHLGQASPDDAKLIAESFEQLSHQLPNVKLVLIGNHKTDIAAYFAQKGNIIETGFVSDSELNDWMAACDLMWLPLCDTITNRGRWPMKLSDYMAAGRATVSTNIGDWSRFFEGDAAVGLLSGDDSAEIAQATVILLTNSDLRSTFEKNARHTVEKQLALSLVAKDLEQFYGECVAKMRE